MVFYRRNRNNFSNLDARINNTIIERLYYTKFLVVQIDIQLTWKKHIGHTCNILSKYVRIIPKTNKELYKATHVALHYSFPYIYVIVCVAFY